MLKKFFAVTAVACMAFTIACKKNTTPIKVEEQQNNDTSGIPAAFKKIYGATEMYVDGDYIVIKSNGLPDHKTPYYKGTQWESTKYEAYNGTKQFAQNPNKIAQVSYTFRIPLKPAIDAAHSATPMGPIGVSLNGVPLFNQYAAGRQPLGSEIVSFDQYNGHPAPGGDYHYHVEPYYLTTNKGKDALLGFLLDGYPVYGPIENGKTVLNTELDAYHGHTHATSDYPDGTYHYHFTDDAPYLNGDGFYGLAGTVSK